MAIEFHALTSGKKKPKRRIGRGLGSQRGAKSGRGQKGQKARSGASGMKRLGLKKLLLATPKIRGFKSPKPSKVVVNLSDLDKLFTDKEVVTPKKLKEKGLIRTERNGVKILGDGELTHAVTVQGCTVSKSAAQAIDAAGGKVIA